MERGLTSGRTPGLPTRELKASHDNPPLAANCSELQYRGTCFNGPDVRPRECNMHHWVPPPPYVRRMWVAGWIPHGDSFRWNEVKCWANNRLLIDIEKFVVSRTNWRDSIPKLNVFVPKETMCTRFVCNKVPLCTNTSSCKSESKESIFYDDMTAVSVQNSADEFSVIRRKSDTIFSKKCSKRLIC